MLDDSSREEIREYVNAERDAAYEDARKARAYLNRLTNIAFIGLCIGVSALFATVIVLAFGAGYGL